jgi:hypothetical protein
MKWVIAAVGLAACGGVNDPKTVDAKMADAPKVVDAAPDADTRRCDPAKPFNTPVPLDDVNTTSYDGWPSLSPDELTMYMFSDRGGAGTLGSYDIFVTTRSSITSAFGNPAPVAGINTTGPDECPTATADGLFIYFNRYAGGVTGWDIWVAQRATTSVDFSNPMPVASLNQSGDILDSNQYPLPNNSAMYWLSGRTSTTNYEIFRATRNVGGTFDQATPVLQTTANENSMVVTPNELTMYFSSDATPTTGGYDIWMTKRTTTADGWGVPVHVDELSSDQDEHITTISPDGCAVYFQRNVTGRSMDIFVARKPL